MRTILLVAALLVSLDARAAKKAERDQLNECRNDLAAVQATGDVHKKAGEYAIARAQELQTEMERIANAMRAAASKIEGSAPLNIEIEEGRMVTKLPGGVLFESGKTELRAEGKDLLNALIAVLKSESERKILLAGHTDNQPVAPGSPLKSNLQLSVLRSIAAFEYLQTQGLDPKRMGVAGYGEYDPDADNTTEEGRAKNRRLEIILLPTPSELQSGQAISTPKYTTPATQPAPETPPPAIPGTSVTPK